MGVFQSARPSTYKDRIDSLRYPKRYDPDAWASYEDADLNRMIFGRANAVQFDPVTRKYIPSNQRTAFSREALEFRLQHATGAERERIEIDLGRRVDPLTGRKRDLLFKEDPLPAKPTLARIDFEDRPVTSEFAARYRSAANKVFGRSLLDQVLDPTVPKERRVNYKGEESYVDPYHNLKRLIFQIRSDLYAESKTFSTMIRWSEEERGAALYHATFKEGELARQPFNPVDAVQESLKDAGYSKEEIQKVLETGEGLPKPATGRGTAEGRREVRALIRERREYGSSLEEFLGTVAKPPPMMEAALLGRGMSAYGGAMALSRGDPEGDPEEENAGWEETQKLPGMVDPMRVKQLHDDPHSIPQTERQEILASNESAAPEKRTRDAKYYFNNPLRIQKIGTLEELEAVEASFNTTFNTSIELGNFFGGLFTQRRGVLQGLANKGAS
jgi:hypothetical protein